VAVVKAVVKAGGVELLTRPTARGGEELPLHRLAALLAAEPAQADLLLEHEATVPLSDADARAGPFSMAGAGWIVDRSPCNLPGLLSRVNAADGGGGKLDVLWLCGPALPPDLRLRVRVDAVVEGPRGSGLAPARAELLFDACRTGVGPLAFLGRSAGLRLRLRAEFVAAGARRVRDPATRREQLGRAIGMLVAQGADVDREAGGHTAWSLSLVPHVSDWVQVGRGGVGLGV
jgi:hypothetical protein